MAKGRRNMNQKKTSRFFENLIQAEGTSVYNHVTAQDLSKKLNSLIKDFVMGNVDVDKYAKYITPDLMESVITEVNRRLVRTQLLNFSMEQTELNVREGRIPQIDPSIWADTKNMLISKLNMYSVLYDCLMKYRNPVLNEYGQLYYAYNIDELKMIPVRMGSSAYRAAINFE